MATDLLKVSPPTQGESLLMQEAEGQQPHKVDENMWKNREQIEEILFLLEAPHWPGSKMMTYMPQDFRGRIIRQQRDRSERNKQAAVDALINSGGSVHDKYVLLWKQQMERRRQLAELGSATGVYKTIMKYLVGVPEVLMDFVRQINDDQGYTFTLSMTCQNDKLRPC
ncbi:hypothetical protein OROMI_020988 [Orobanche minor]